MGGEIDGPPTFRAALLIGAALTMAGPISRLLFTAGPVAQGRFRDMAALPGIRQQSGSLAAHIAMQVPLRTTAL